MNDADKKLLELADKATPLPYHMHEGDLVNSEHVDVYWAEDDSPDAEYIVAAANAVPRLIAEKEALLKALRQIRNCQFNGIVAMNIAEEALAADAAAAKEPDND